MRVDIVGGGPAGLLLAILLRRDGIADDVRVFERHEQDVTYGWGVVFPEGALTELERADYPTFAAIKESGTTWTPVEIRYKSTRRRVNGNTFHGISRAVLLSILREKAASLGARLTFNHRVGGLAEHEGADVVVGADGVNSIVRQELREFFRPRIEHSTFKYAWFGVDHNFRDFTYIFQETEWGLFRAYCYPAGQTWSSLIIHVSEDTWRRSGLVHADEAESIRRCQDIFADNLAGKAILSNHSGWTSFPYLSCRTWHHDNVVLIGDAAHTAHWSIGAGTRLAIEDAITLADRLRTAADVPSALAGFEAARRGTVEKFQDASRRSERYFENLPRYFDFEPIQFAYQLMTRSWRITHSDIARRDPGFVAKFNSWFYTRATGTATDIAPPPAFAPFRIGGTVFDNRIATRDATTDAAKGAAKGAADDSGLVIATTPDTPSGATPAAVRLSRAGSPDAYREAASDAAERGYSVVLLDLATDALPALRERPWLHELAALRDAWPADRPVGAVVSLDHPADAAADADDFVALARALAAGGAGVVLLESTRRAPRADAPRADAPGGGAPDPAMRLAQVADAVRNEVGIAVIVDGAATTLEEANTIVAAGWADMCVLPAPIDAAAEGGLSSVA